MTTKDWGAEIRKAGRNHCAEITRPINPYLHKPSAPPSVPKNTPARSRLYPFIARQVRL